MRLRRRILLYVEEPKTRPTQVALEYEMELEPAFVAPDIFLQVFNVILDH
jgi:hypothetical protein